MPVPKKKKSKARVRQHRYANSALTAPSLSTCSNCNEVTLPHRVCPSCGFYKGKSVLTVKKDAA